MLLPPYHSPICINFILVDKLIGFLYLGHIKLFSDLKAVCTNICYLIMLIPKPDITCVATADLYHIVHSLQSFMMMMIIIIIIIIIILGAIAHYGSALVNRLLASRLLVGDGGERSSGQFRGDL